MLKDMGLGVNSGVSLMVQEQRICLPMQETQVQSLGWEDPLEKGMATHSSILGESDGQGNLAGYTVHRVAFGSLGCLWFRVQFNVRQSVGHD